MKAYIYFGKNALKIQEIDKPLLPKGGGLAKIRYSSICGTDLRTFRHGNDHIQPPKVIGHEAIYELEEVSTELTNSFHKGMRVIVAPAIGCGTCTSCQHGRTNMCDTLKTIGFDYDGTFAEYCAIPKQAFLMNNVIEVDEKVKDIEACVVEPVACAINGQSFLKIQPGENVLIFGAGFLGCIHSELAQLKGARKVIIAEISELRRRSLKSFLPDVETIDPAENKFLNQLSEITNGSGIDVVITACPVGRTQTQALEVVNKSGRISLFGGLAGESKGFLDSNLIHYKELSVHGVHASTTDQNKEALLLIKEGKINLEKYLSIFSFNEIENAFNSLFSESIVKAVLRF